MQLNLKNKNVLVTGGSRGIGKAICIAFAREGANMIINYRNNKEVAENLASDLEKEMQVKAVAIGANLENEDQLNQLLHQSEKALGSIDILINNAAVCPSGPIQSYTREIWEETFSVNVTGMFLLSKFVVSRWIEKGYPGAIVNMVSQAAFRGSTTGHLPYDSSKGAMVSFTIGLAREVAKYGIRVNAVAPGLVRTEMVAKTWEEKKERYLQTIPLFRIAEPEEIASVVVFIASDKASYITGTTIDVSGGMLMR